MRNRDIVVGYDNNCTDGVMGAALARQLTGADKTIFIGIDHPVSFDQINALFIHASKKADLFFVDTAPPAGLVERLAERYREVTICDHHKTKEAEYSKLLLPDNVQTFFDSNKCGAEVFFDEVVARRNRFAERPATMELVSLVDLGKDKEPNYFAISSFLDTRVHPDNLLRAFRELKDIEKIRLSEVVAQGNRWKDGYVEAARRLLRHPRHIIIDFENIGPTPTPIIEANIRMAGGRVLGDLARAYASHMPSHMYLIAGRSNGTTHLSVRTDGSVNAGSVAQFLGKKLGSGGGGHEHTAAAQVSTKALYTVIKESPREPFFMPDMRKRPASLSL